MYLLTMFDISDILLRHSLVKIKPGLEHTNTVSFNGVINNFVTYVIEESYLINFFRKNDVQSVASPLYSRFFIFKLSRMFFQIERREFFPTPCNAKSSIIFCTFWVGWCKRSVNFISNFSCSHFNQKPNEIIFLISALRI